MSSQSISTTQKRKSLWVSALEAVAGRTLADEFESTDHYRIVETRVGANVTIPVLTYVGSTSVTNGVGKSFTHPVSARDDPVESGWLRVLPGGMVG